MLIVLLIGLIGALSYSPEISLMSYYNPYLTITVVFLSAFVAPLAGLLLNTIKKRTLQTNKGSKQFTAGAVGVRLFILISYLASIYIFNWPIFIDKTLKLKGFVLVNEILLILPLVAALVIYLLSIYEAHCRIRNIRTPLTAYLNFHIRNGILLLLIPYLLLLTTIDLLELIPALEERPLAQAGILFAIIFLIYLFSPFWLRLIWKSKPLPKGPLRKRLETIATQNSIRYRDILIWDTFGWRVANASVAGLVGPLRYVFISDTLLENLSDDEVVAVFGHEMGHIKFRHIPFFLLFAVCFGVTIGGMQALVMIIASILKLSESISLVLSGVLFVGVIGLYWGVLFGYISRRFERLSDIFAAFVVGDIDSFSRSLERIALLNGVPRQMRSFRHFSIDKRINFLIQSKQNMQAVKKIERSLKKALYVFFLVTLISIVFIITATVYFSGGSYHVNNFLLTGDYRGYLVE